MAEHNWSIWNPPHAGQAVHDFAGQLWHLGLNNSGQWFARCSDGHYQTFGSLIECVAWLNVQRAQPAA